MKKLITILMCMLMLATLVSAQNGVQIGTNQNYELRELQVNGLDNAQLRVQNEEQAQQIQEIMLRVETRNRERINQLEKLEIREQDGKVIAEGQINTKFLGLISMQRSIQYNVADDGSVEHVPKFYRLLFRDEVEV